MITKDLLKKEIDLVREEYLIALYQIIKTFERPYDIEKEPPGETGISPQQNWHNFIDKFAGSLENCPIQRGDQGTLETRESLQ
ncbi:MAG: hypothetical protein GY757_00895 [bacterium]|nr:hypothetical protein [bacterium]